jgi:hypothetical protein
MNIQQKLASPILKGHTKYEETTKKYQKAVRQTKINLSFLVCVFAIYYTYSKMFVGAPSKVSLVGGLVGCLVVYLIAKEALKVLAPDIDRGILFWRVDPFKFYGPLITEVEAVGKHVLKFKTPEEIWDSFLNKVVRIARMKLEAMAEQIAYLEKMAPMEGDIWHEGLIVTERLRFGDEFVALVSIGLVELSDHARYTREARELIEGKVPH